MSPVSSSASSKSTGPRPGQMGARPIQSAARRRLNTDAPTTTAPSPHSPPAPSPHSPPAPIPTKAPRAAPAPVSSAPAESPELTRLKNGCWRDSPISLTVFGLSTFHQMEAVDQVTRQIAKMAPGTVSHPDDLVVTPGSLAANGHAETARVSWSPWAWYRQVDLLGEMDRVRKHLNPGDRPEQSCYWSCSAKEDRRAVGTFVFEQQTSTMVPPAASPESCVVDFCRERGVKLGRYHTTGFGRGKTHHAWGSVHVTLAAPAHLDTLERDLTKEMQKNDSKFGSYKVAFHRSPDVIPISHPATIVGLDRGLFPEELNLPELSEWVTEFNRAHGTTEHLLEVSPGRVTGRVRGHAFFVPSSVGLAEFLVRQQPIAGDPYELAYVSNGNRLVPSGRAEANRITNLADSVKELQEAVEHLEKNGGALRDQVDRAVKEMSRLNNNFASFGGDHLVNLQRLFNSLKQACDTDAAIMAENMRSIALDNQLNMLDSDLRMVRAEIDLLESEQTQTAGQGEEGEKTMDGRPSPDDKRPSDSTSGEDGDDSRTEAQHDRRGPLSLSRSAVGMFDQQIELKLAKQRLQMLSESRDRVAEDCRSSENEVMRLAEQRESAVTLRDSTGLGIMSYATQSSASSRPVLTTPPATLPTPSSSSTKTDPANTAVTNGARPVSRNDPTPLPGAPAKKARTGRT